MSKILVIVESPTKAKTIGKFLGADFHVTSSMGHVRDLPKSDMGVDIEGGTFAPTYEIPATKKKTVAALKKMAKDASDILFATDEDREGEAISWHLAELLGIKEKNVKRLVFHEITKEAIARALSNPRPLNVPLVDAQQARRVLDRLVGYELSPLLWRKVRYGLSAGRVQSVAVHLIVEREEARARFASSTYADLLATLAVKDDTFTARLIRLTEKPIPSAKDFDPATGELKAPDTVAHLTHETAEILAVKLRDTKPWTVTSVTETPYKTNPYPPFITSTLQQEGSRKLGWSARETMRTAQALYEQGYITYMRTDSVHLSDQAIAAAQEAAREFGVEYVAAVPKQYESKSALAQEAHEAIRPAGSSFMHPEKVAAEVSSAEAKLYDLIWKRTVASQMKSAEMMRTQAEIMVADAVFEAKGKRILFAGYLRAYVEGADDPAAELEDKEVVLPALQEEEVVAVRDLVTSDHSTEPPARFTEASLIKILEHEGVGRPSTYATILDTIIEREYVVKQGSALVPTFTAMIVDRYLRDNFAPLVDVHFTSNMERDLDRIAEGTEEWQPYIRHFYSEDKKLPFHAHVEAALKSEEYPHLTLGNDPASGKPIFIKSGKYGPYISLGDGEEKVQCSLPENIAPADVTVKQAVELLEASARGPEVVGTDKVTGLSVTFRTGRFGPYLQIGEDDHEDKKKKAKKIGLTYGPKRMPISPSLDLANLTAVNVEQLLLLPRTLGDKDGVPIIVSVGRFGPYIKCADDFRSIPKTLDILTMTLADALAILATEKTSRRRKTATILKELGNDPESGKPIQLLDGRYGPYVSNGTRTFVSLPKEETAETLTLASALLLLATKAKTKGKKRSRRSTTV